MTRKRFSLATLFIFVIMLAVILTLPMSAEEYKTGDMNGDGQINTDDAIYLLRHVLSPDNYPLGCNHNLTEHEEKAPTCTEAGHNSYVDCSRCNYTTYKEIGALGHTEVIDPKVDPDYGKTGLTEGKHCSLCNEVLVKQEIIPALTPTTYTITYVDEKQFSETNDIQVVEYQQHLTNTLPKPTIAGYKFEGWYTKPDGNGDKVIFISAGNTESITLYAHWAVIEYEVTYKDAAVNNNRLSYTIEDEFILTAPVWDGLEFLNWSDDKGNPIRKIEKGTTGNLVLTANWLNRENKAIPKTSDRELMVVYTPSSNQYHFIYELGTIENVILKKLNTQTKANSTIEWSFSETYSVEESDAKSVANTTTRSTSQTTEYEEARSHVYEKSGTVSSALKSSLEAEYMGVKAKVEASIETSVTESDSWTNSNSKTESNTNENEQSQSVATTVSYNSSTSHAVEVTRSVASEMPVGKYTLACVGTTKVYAVVTYDSDDGKYYLDTYSIICDDISISTLYSPDSSISANIVTSDALPYDIPMDEVEKYVNSIYTIEYETNGGSFVEDKTYPKTYMNLNGAYIPSNIPELVHTNSDGSTEFIGWYEDAEFTTEFNGEKLKTNPRNLTLYAKLYKVYSDIEKTPATITDTRVKIDWSQATSISYNDKLNIKNTVKELIIIGNPELTYKNFSISLVGFEKNQEFMLRLENFKFIANTVDAISVCDDLGAIFSIEIIGDCSIETTYASGNIINMPNNNVTIMGTGNLNIIAGSGADGLSYGASGSAGGIGIKANNLTINTGSMNVYGGDGGNGKDGARGNDASDYDKSATAGTDGGNGGRGGDAINVKNVNLLTQNIYLYGGKGGNGGNGGDGGNGKTKQGQGPTNIHNTPGNGGDAGDGGDGGDGGNTGLSYNLNNGSKGGNGGSHGNAGTAGEAGHFWWDPWVGANQHWYGNPGNPGEDGDDGIRGS